MAQHSFIKTVSGVLIPATAETKRYLNLIKVGSVIFANFKKVRNPVFHRKYFSLLNLGFEYWVPAGGVISPADKLLIRGYVVFLCKYAGAEEVLQAAADEYLEDVARSRVVSITAEKSFEAFRRWVTVQAGFYDEFVMPDGSRHLEPRSISFAKMDDLEFHELYRATLDVLWNFILFRAFPTQQAAENAGWQLLEYAA